MATARRRPVRVSSALNERCCARGAHASTWSKTCHAGPTRSVRARAARRAGAALRDSKRTTTWCLRRPGRARRTGVAAGSDPLGRSRGRSAPACVGRTARPRGACGGARRRRPSRLPRLVRHWPEVLAAARSRRSRRTGDLALAPVGLALLGRDRLEPRLDGRGPPAGTGTAFGSTAALSAARAHQLHPPDGDRQQAHDQRREPTRRASRSGGARARTRAPAAPPNTSAQSRCLRNVMTRVARARVALGRGHEPARCGAARPQPARPRRSAPTAPRSACRRRRPSPSSRAG